MNGTICFCKHCGKSSEVVYDLDTDIGKTFFLCPLCGTLLGIECNGTRLWLQTAQLSSALNRM